MIVYFDTSALVAVYVDDDCSEEARSAFWAADRVATSLLTYAETLGVFSALLRVRAVTKAQRERIEGEFLVDWAWLQRVRLESRLLPDIRRMVRHHPLKGAAAVHLASSLFVAHGCASAGIDYRFACNDRTLAAAASAEGLTLAW
ncbi:MAG TPA: type II toxin-antitoxin system VapC family toxin [Polyangiaceae bacterium]|nr:type II toxin-antitoxin system VapC family toxin [Polyangiaceae bacterium]